jgi:hypothetical protein
MRRAALGLLVLAAAGGVARAQAGAPDPKRRVAVLEYRSGSDAVGDIGARVAGHLRART